MKMELYDDLCLNREVIKFSRNSTAIHSSQGSRRRGTTTKRRRAKSKINYEDYPIILDISDRL